MSLETSRFQLHSALKATRLRWEETCEHWDDGVRRDFEKTFWNNVEPSVLVVMASLDKLAQVIGKLKHECEGRGE